MYKYILYQVSLGHKQKVVLLPNKGVKLSQVILTKVRVH